MADREDKPEPMLLGIFNRPQSGLDAADLIALVLSGIWLLGCVVVSHCSGLRPAGVKAGSS